MHDKKMDKRKSRLRMMMEEITRGGWEKKIVIHKRRMKIYRKKYGKIPGVGF